MGKEIRPISNNGGIRLRFSVAGKRYSFAPIPNGEFASKKDLKAATAIAERIQADISRGNFDPTLERYKPPPPVPPINPSPHHSPPPVPAAPPPPLPQPQRSMLTAWDIWIESLGLSPETKADHYEMIRRMIVKAQPGWENTAWLTEAKLAPSTFNKRLGYLKRFFSWAIEEGYAASNTFGKVKSRKAPKKKIHPLTQTEIGRILEAFSQRHPHYVPFVKFLLQTGVRTSEAIGIQWKHIDLEREEIRVCESLPKDRTGNGYQRKRKGTKTSQERILSMTSSLKAWLTGFKPAGAKSDDLLFHSAKGCVIDAGNFREDWKAILASLDIPYRRPYETRHTLLSHAIEQGIPITGVAYIAGHTDTRMVMTTYGHLINRPELPDILGE